MLNRISIQVGIIISLIIFTVIAVFTPVFTSDSQIEILLGATTFVYGIIIAFYISFSTSRLNEIGQILNSEDSTFVSIYRTVSVFGKEIQKKIQNLLDNLIIDSVDYYLQDYDKTIDKFEEMSKYVLELEPKNESQVEAYSTLLNLLAKNQENRTRITSLTKQRMFFYEWLVLVVLNSVILFCIFYLNSHNFITIVISILLSTSTVILLFILRDLNHLRWKEQIWIWESLKQTFKEIGLLAYYPADAIKEGRVMLTRGDKVRVAYYKHAYPDFRDKDIKEIVVE